MRKLAAHYIFVKEAKALKNAYLIIDEQNIVLEIGVLESETQSTEFFNGILVPDIEIMKDFNFDLNNCKYGFVLGQKHSVYNFDQVLWHVSKISPLSKINKIA